MMELASGQNRMNRQEFSWNQISILIQFSLIFMNLVAPILAVYLIVFHSDFQIYGTLMFAVCFVQECVYLLFLKVRVQHLVAGIVSYFLSIFLLILFVFEYGFQTSLLICPLLLLFVYYRLHLLIASKSLANDAHTAFIQDVVFCILALVVGFISSSFKDLFIDGTAQMILFAIMIVMAGRIMVSWKIERLDSKNNKQVASIWFILCLVIVAGLLFILAPWLYFTFSSILTIIAGGVFLVIFKPVFSFLEKAVHVLGPKANAHLHAKAPSHSASKSSIHHHLHSVSHTTLNIEAGIVTIAVIVLAVKVMMYLARKSKTSHTKDERKTDDSQETIKSWIGRKRKLYFQKTDDVERLRYQKWLYAEHLRGHSIGDSQTPREFLREMLTNTSEPDAKIGIETTTRYERTQYGQKSTEV